MCLWRGWRPSVSGGAGGIWKRVRPGRKTPPWDSVRQNVNIGWMGQLTPMRWKRLHAENVGDRLYKRICLELQGTGADTRLRDVQPDDRTFTRSRWAFRSIPPDLVWAEWMGFPRFRASQVHRGVFLCAQSAAACLNTTSKCLLFRCRFSRSR